MTDDETVRTLLCATPQTDQPPPRGAPEEDLGLPPSLDRTNGKSREEIDAERERLAAADRNPDGSRKIENPSRKGKRPKLPGPPPRAKAKPKEKPAKSKAMPLSGKAAAEAIRGKTKPASKPKAPATPKEGESKLEMITRMLKSAKGCTTAEVLAATKWPSVSMPQQARAAGLRLVKEKDGRVTRYRAAS